MLPPEDIYDIEDDSDEPTSTSCKRCGKTGCHWENDDGEWNLYESRYQLHRCNMQKASAEDFEVLT
jgi:hypothetical protein